MDSFAIGPVGTKALWFFVVIMVILLAVFALLAWSAWSTRHSRVDIEPAGIRLVGDLWGRRIPFEKLQVDQARRINLHQEPEFGLKWRTMGTGLPGYAAGWFKLRNGDKALVYVTRRDDVVHVPTTEGYAVMLTVAEPDRFLARLREAASLASRNPG
jgi:hypothetical protein